MHARHLLPAIICLFPALAAAETLHSLKGQTYEGKLSSVHSDLVVLSSRKGSVRATLNDLDDASLALIAAWQAAQPVAAPWAQSQSPVAKVLAKRLQVLRDGKLVPYNPGTRAEPEFYLVYYGAFWCGPCRRFSPELLDAYKEMKSYAGDRFEVIFCSDDHDASGQLDYAREVGMPWPIARFGSSLPVLDRWRGRGIPCLIVVNRDGEVLFHSYSGEEYLGAQDPLEKFQILLKWVHHDLPTPGRHRLAIAQHLLNAKGGDLDPKPYRITFDRASNHSLPAEGVIVQFTVDEHGHTDAPIFTPALGAVPAQQLQREVEKWLFLPAVKQGRAARTVVEMPLKPSVQN